MMSEKIPIGRIETALLVLPNLCIHPFRAKILDHLAVV